MEWERKGREREVSLFVLTEKWELDRWEGEGKGGGIYRPGIGRKWLIGERLL